MWLITYIVNGYKVHQIIYGQGGPDAYGYVWKDQKVNLTSFKIFKKEVER
jgi:hypothetical protein